MKKVNIKSIRAHSFGYVFKSKSTGALGFVKLWTFKKKLALFYRLPNARAFKLLKARASLGEKKQGFCALA
jgi:hypothetical protein